MKERISDIEDRIEEINTQEKKMLNLKIFWQKLQELQDTMKRPNLGKMVKEKGEVYQCKSMEIFSTKSYSKFP